MAFFTIFPILAFYFAMSFSSPIMGQLKDGAAPPPPPFLQGIPADKIEEFHQLLSNSGTQTDQQIEEAVKAWIAKQDEGIKSKFAVFEEEKNKMEAAQEQAHQKATSKFSPKAKEADAKLTEIAKNPSLAAQDKTKQIEDFVQSLPKEVRDEIEKAMQG